MRIAIVNDLNIAEVALTRLVSSVPGYAIVCGAPAAAAEFLPIQKIAPAILRRIAKEKQL